MALSGPRDVKRWGGGGPERLIEDPMKGSTTIYQGALVVRNAGYLAPGTTATGLVAVGRAEQTVVNAGADGAKRCRVMSGVFHFKNSLSGDAIAQSDVGALCYIVDDETVAKTSDTNARSVAGTIRGLRADGQVWVAVGEDFK